MTEDYKSAKYLFSPQGGTPVKPLILLVEADQDSRDLLKILLELSGYEVTTAINGEQALSLLDSLRPNLVLIETRLPDFDGLAFMRRLRRHWLLSQVPIVATSCNSTAAFRNEALAAGCNELLVKPLDFNSLEHSLKKHLSQS